MKPTFPFLKIVWRTGDWQAGLLLLLVAVVAGWLVLLPISRSVQRISMERFHLATPRFWQWAVQGPIPAMYNFENRYWVSQQPLTATQLLLSIENAKKQQVNSAFLNHFPARIFTFGDSRLICLQKEKQYWLALQTRYRDQELMTVLEAVEDSTGGFRLERRNMDSQNQEAENQFDRMARREAP